MYLHKRTCETACSYALETIGCGCTSLEKHMQHGFFAYSTACVFFYTKDLAFMSVY